MLPQKAARRTLTHPVAVATAPPGNERSRAASISTCELRSMLNRFLMAASITQSQTPRCRWECWIALPLTVGLNSMLGASDHEGTS